MTSEINEAVEQRGKKLDNVDAAKRRWLSSTSPAGLIVHPTDEVGESLKTEVHLENPGCAKRASATV